MTDETNEVVAVGSLEVAEASKLLENIFRAVNIALVNELKIVFDRMGIDIWEVIEAAKTKPFGFMPFYHSKGEAGQKNTISVSRASPARRRNWGVTMP